MMDAGSPQHLDRGDQQQDNLWRSVSFRLSLIQKLEEVTKTKGNSGSVAREREEEVFRRCGTKEEYLANMVQLITTLTGPGTEDQSDKTDKNSNITPQSTFLTLHDSLADNVKQASDLAMDTVVGSLVPLVSCRYTKPDVLNAVKNCKKIVKVESRLLALMVLTDQVVAGIVSHIVDIFQFTLSQGKIKVLEQLGKVWSDTFSEVNQLYRLSSTQKPDKKVMVEVLNFLRRQKASLLVLEDKSFSSSFILKLSSSADQCFWNYSLETIDGRKKVYVKPVEKKTRTPNKLIKALPSRFVSSASLTPPTVEPATRAPPYPAVEPGPAVELSPEGDGPGGDGPEVLAVRKVLVSSYGFANSEKTVSSCQVYHDGKIRVSIYSNQTILQGEDLTNVVLSPDPEKPLLFLYLSARGANQVLVLIQKIPGILCSPFTRGGQHNRRIVVCMASISKEQEDFLVSVFRELMKERFTTVRSTYSQLLLLKVIDLSKAFNSAKSEDEMKQVLVTEILDSLVEKVTANKNQQSLDVATGVLEEILTTVINEACNIGIESEEVNVVSVTILEIRSVNVERVEDGTPATPTNNNISSYLNRGQESVPKAASYFQTKKRKEIEDKEYDVVNIKKMKQIEDIKFPNNNTSDIIDLTKDSVPPTVRPQKTTEESRTKKSLNVIDLSQN